MDKFLPAKLPVLPLVFLFLASLLLTPAKQAWADGARFDLAGPKLEVRVTRAGLTLPIAEVPNLQPGDKLWVHPDFPSTQSVHYLMVVAFLRGTTNPPPDSWFTRIETWNPKVREEGTFITVPTEAQQVLLFLAPETSGDFSTLRSAVKGRPGTFVRASQDLNQAGFEQARIERYIDDMQKVPAGDAKALADHSALLARALALKPNNDCFKQPVDQQAVCLTQSGNQLLLDDGHGQSVADSLTSGPSSDFINAASYTSAAGGGLYSAYVGAVVDLVHLTSTLHTAQYQYIPAIAFPNHEELNLRLNAPPSFHNPKSVIVVGLPAIQTATPPPLRAADPKHITCMLEPKLVFGLDGAPLVYSTGLAHDLVLHLNIPGNHPDIPLVPDAFQGGLVPAPKPEREPLAVDLVNSEPAPQAARSGAAKSGAAAPIERIPPTPPGAQLTGTVRGMWGFDPFTGPTLPLQNVPGTNWRILTTDPLIAGQDNHLLLAASGTACVDRITADIDTGTPDATGKSKLTWKPAEKPNQIALTLPLKQTVPEAVHFQIKQFGLDGLPDTVAAKALSEPAKLKGFSFHAGDQTATLKGTSLDQVKQLEVKGVVFTPSATQPAPTNPTSSSDTTISLVTDKGSPDDELTLAPDPKTPALKLNPGDRATANVTLKDGRVLNLPVAIEQPRPVVTLLSKSVDRPKDSAIHLAPDDLPLSEHFTFFLKSQDNFPRAEQIEIASTDGALHTILTIADRTLVLQNKHTVYATLEPLKLFGPSAFGPLRLRAIAPDGTTGDWIPLVTLVRLPTLSELRCPVHARQQPCTLTGSDLFLVDSFSTDPSFATATAIPEGFVGTSVALFHPQDPTFYVRLRDDPAATDQVTLPILPQPQPQLPTQAAAAPQPQQVTPSSAAPTTAAAPPPATSTPTAPAAPSTGQPDTSAPPVNPAPMPIDPNQPPPGSPIPMETPAPSTSAPHPAPTPIPPPASKPQPSTTPALQNPS
ncbi:MAG TPA: hypothetical protein VH250_09235 [Granulicella sp.]|nr:hypothetical protein [Granulicella sp.]